MQACIDYVDNDSFGYLDKKREALEFWCYIAPRFSNYSNVIFEVYNEPDRPYDWLTWKREMAQPLVNLIRQHATENLILVGGPNFCLDMSGAVDNPVIDPVRETASIAYVTHSYPFHSANPQRPIAKVLDPIVEKVPVFVSEWGFEQGSQKLFHGTADVFGKETINYLNKYKLGWTAWVYDYLWSCRWLM